MFNLFRKETKTLKMEEVPGFLREKFRGEIENLDNRLLNSVREIEADFIAVQDVLTVLEAKKSEQQYANIIKNRFCSNARGAISGVDFSRPSREVIESSMKALKMMGEISMKEFRHLHAFKDDMSEIAEHSRSLENLLSAARKTILASPVTRMEEITRLAEKDAEMRNKLAGLEDELNQESAAVTGMKNALEAKEIETGMINTAASPETDHLLKESVSIKSRIENEFSGMEKIFKKYAYFGDMTKEETDVLKDYIKGSGEAFLRDTDSVMKKILYSLDAFRDRKLLGIDDGRREKIRDLIRHFDFLVEMREAYQETETRMSREKEERERENEAARGRVKAATSEADAIRKDIARLESRIRSVSLEKDVLEKDIIGAKTKVGLLMAELLNSNFAVA